MIINKKEITNEINNCKKSGYEIIIFQTDKPKRAQEKGMTDYFLTGGGAVIMLELKLPSDKLSEIQKKLLRKLFVAMKNNYSYFVGILNADNYKKVVDLIIARNWPSLKSELSKTELLLYK